MIMSTATRIVVGVSTAVKQWSRRRMVNQWSSNKCPSIYCNKYRDLSTDSHRDFREIGYTDVADLLTIPERDFLVRNNGQKVPISSLKGKLVGLYLCENIPDPTRNRMKAIKKVYEESELRGYDFEIIQITFDFNAAEHHSTNPIVHQFREDILWLSLPSRDPSFKKIQRIFRCADEKDTYWGGDSLVLVHPPQALADDSSGVLFEFSGAEILERWGIEGYPFTRQSLYKAEYELQKREVTLQWFFPPGESLLWRPLPIGDGFDLVDAHSQLSPRDGFHLVDAHSQLSGKRVLVLFSNHYSGLRFLSDDFVSMLKYEYEAQLEDNVEEERKFEVVYVSTGRSRKSLSFDECIKDMPWLVYPFPSEVNRYLMSKAFKPYPREVLAAVAFNEQGELIAKRDRFHGWKKEGHKLQFPFIDPDLEKCISEEVEEALNKAKYGIF